MPLIIFAGYPSSGKTTWAKKLANQLEEKIKSLHPNEPGSNLKVVVHNDESLGIKHSMYGESSTEKSARGIQMSAVKRDISKNNIVILDGLSYNKGFRYQLFCESKSLGTPNCVIQLICPTEVCFEWNESRINDDKWDDALLRQMIARYEEPDGSKRWDSPLIPLAYDDTQLPFGEIWEIIALRKGPKPNLSTIVKPALGTNFLQELDKLTNQVVGDIVAYQNIDKFGELRIKNVDDTYCFVDVPSLQVSTATFQRIRRTFINLNRVRNVEIDRIIPLFVEYMTNSLNV